MGSDIENLTTIYQLDVCIDQLTKNLQELQDKGKTLEYPYDHFVSTTNILDELKKKNTEISLEIEKLTNDKLTIINTLPISMNKLYEHFRVNNKSVLAEINQGCCSGCRIKIRHSLIQEIAQNSQLTTCEYCGRILCLNLPPHKYL